MKLRFLGAAGTVTGSKTLVTSGGRTVLVDCGMFQGYKQQRLRNWSPLEVDPRAIDAVILTHAHLDHSGWLPALVRDGFLGSVHCTKGTADLLGVILPDAGRIQEEDAEYANRKGFSKHSPARAMYTEADALRALERVRPVDWSDEVSVGQMRATFHPVGHILGASSVRLADPSTSVLFSGDVGRSADLLMRPPCAPPAAEHLVVEATYGDRFHDDEDLLEALASVVERTVDRGGMLLIPAFAVGRAQSVLWALHTLQESGRIPDVPLVLDSPMAVNATELYFRNQEELRLTGEEVRSLYADVRLVRSVDESRSLNGMSGPFVLVSSSGMLTGGRVLHHVANRAPAEQNTLLFVGYQAPGTRGSRLVGGETRTKIHGRYVPVRCEVVQVGGFSAHADQRELLDWMGQMPDAPKRVFVNHGEPGPVDTLRSLITEELGWYAEAATEGVEWDLASPVGATSSLPPTRGPEPKPAFLRADRDLDFLDRDDMRAVRLMLEYLKVEKALVDHEITGTVVVFGSTRLGATDGATAEITERLAHREHYYDEARRLGQLVGQAGELAGERVAVVTGGGPGIMEAGNRGAHEVGAPSIGLNIVLPREQAPNPYITPELCFQFRYFALRKMHFLRRARALVAFPGGFGTFDELFDALCLVQTGKMPKIPVVLVGSEYWNQVFRPDFLAMEGLIDPDDVRLVQVVESADEAWARIRAFYAEGQPSRK